MPGTVSLQGEKLMMKWTPCGLVVFLVSHQILIKRCSNSLNDSKSVRPGSIFKSKIG